MTEKALCAKIKDCHKVGMILDKDLAGDWQYAESVRVVCARCSEGQDTKQQSRYVRLSATALYRVPDCYGGTNTPAPLPSACVYCVVGKQCQEKQEVLRR